MECTNAGLEELSGLQLLHTLNLSNTEISDEGIRQLARHKGLVTLLIPNTNITAAGLKELYQSLPRLLVVK